MELPFKYIVLCIIRTLNERKMPLVIGKSNLMNYFKELIRKSYFTIDEKKEIVDNFDFEYEMDDLFNKYYKYFDYNFNNITFDIEYVDELDSLISSEMDEFDVDVLFDIDIVIESDPDFLEILGVKINKNLYNYLLDIEKEIELCYVEMANINNSLFKNVNNLNNVKEKLKRLMLKKTVMFLNTKFLLSYIQYRDLIRYSSNVVEANNVFDELKFLLENDQFDENDVMRDVFLKAIFISSPLYYSNLEESLIYHYCDMNDRNKYNIINFYLKFLDLLDKELAISSGIISMELIKVKYRLMNVMDSVYNTTLFLGNKNILFGDYKENYDSFESGAYYFVKELLLYDDDQYRNKSFDMDNVMVYLNNILKKIFIETYYNLTYDKNIISMIKENELYGINNISSGFLLDIVNKSKTKEK